MKNGETWDLVAQLAARPEFGMTRGGDPRRARPPAATSAAARSRSPRMTAACRTLIGSDAQSAEEITL